MHRNGISILDKLYLWILTEYVIYEVRIAVHNSFLLSKSDCCKTSLTRLSSI